MDLIDFGRWVGALFVTLGRMAAVRERGWGGRLGVTAPEIGGATRFTNRDFLSEAS